VGAHLSGQPLEHELTGRGGRLVTTTRTAPVYRLYVLPGAVPPKPGLVRVAAEGVGIEVEVWELPVSRLGDFLLGVPSPLAVGTVELADGTRVHGFLCEAYAVAGAPDISASGGWRAHLAAPDRARGSDGERRPAAGPGPP
jgi:allophanate hydrolase